MWARLKQKLSCCMQKQPMLVYLYMLMMLTSDILVPVHSLEHTLMPKDVISAEELTELGHVHTFSGGADVDYFKILSQEEDFILIGGRNVLHNISLKTLEEDTDRNLHWHSTAKAIKKCNDTNIPNPSKCDNFIRVLGKVDTGELIVCGTNAFSPECRIYQYKPDEIPKYISKRDKVGKGMCPFDPEHNTTALFAGRKLYSGTNSDMMARDPLIMASDALLMDGYIIRTRDHNSDTLSEADFVNSFEVDDMIYFFLREKAVEAANCGKVFYSRVARVCKNDQGNRINTAWTSFFKARLMCTIQGDIPFAFDELQSTSNFTLGNYQPTKKPGDRKRMIYGVFNTAENSIHGSAVCAYTYDDIVAAFSGKFKNQDSPTSYWVPLMSDKTPSPHPAATCMNNSKNLEDAGIAFVDKHPLMDSPVTPVSGGPIFFETNSHGRFTAIVVDWQVLATDRMFYDVIFVGTSDGRVLKVINNGRNGHVNNVVIEDIQVLGKNEAVNELRIYSRGEKLIVVSQENLVSIPLHRCSRHKMCGDCVAQQDPYCAWFSNECTTHTSRGLQDILSGDTSKCPDGGKREKSLVTTSTTTEKPLEVDVDIHVVCPDLKCDCNKSALVAENNTKSDHGTEKKPKSEDTDAVLIAPSTDKKCAPKYIAIRSDDQVYTASTLAIASVVSIVVSILIGFAIGYRVSMCRNSTRNTEQMISYEQNFGSLRKNPNRHSIEASHNFYSDPNVQKPFKIQNNILVSNNIAQKNPNAPNGSIESKTMTAKQVAKTYL